MSSKQKHDRFDLEQEILKFSNITDDIEILIQNSSDEKLKAAVSGLVYLYNLRFESLWGIFEELIQEKKIL